MKWQQGVLVVSSALFLLTLHASPARAYSCMQLGCPRWCAPVEYYVGALSSDLEALEAGATLVEVTRGMEDWTLVSCSGLSTSYAGRTSAGAITGDGVSTIAFYESDWPYDINAIGMTTYAVVSNCLVEADIALNAQSFTWSRMPGSPGIVNAYSVVLHEGGHFYGLGHTGVREATMYLSYGRGTLVLREDDVQGICYLYPGEDPPPDCATAGCPSGFTCEDGVCEVAPIPLCMADTDCGADQRCHLASGACIPRIDGGEGLGIACEDDTECDTGLCAHTAEGSLCSQTCDALDPYSCHSGFHCSGQAVNDCAVGLCMPGGVGVGTFGSPCERHTDCASLHCAGSICSFPCSLGDFQSCPSTYTCLSQVSGACSACGRPRALGERCQHSVECESALCFEHESRGGLCSRTCNARSDCPDGFVCDVDGESGMGVCLPRRRGGCHAAPLDATSSSTFLWPLLALAIVAGRRRRE